MENNLLIFTRPAFVDGDFDSSISGLVNWMGTRLETWSHKWDGIGTRKVLVQKQDGIGTEIILVPSYWNHHEYCIILSTVSYKY